MSEYSAHIDTFARDNLPAPGRLPEFRFDLPELQYPARMNCAAELLDRAVETGHGERPVIWYPDGSWSYAQLLERVNRLARVLVDDLGVVPGNRVLLRAPNSPMLAACWLAVVKAGGIAVATMPMLRAGELKVITEKAQVGLALCDARLADELERARGEPGVLARVVCYDGAGAELDRLAARRSSAFETIPTARDDVCLLAFTSGTTGQPKATMHYHRDVLAMADTFARHVLHTEPTDIYCGTPPLAFTFGLGAELVFPMRFHASVAYLEQPSPPALLAAVERYRLTGIFTSPTGYRAMLGELGQRDISSLRQCISAGETLPRPTFEAWEKATGLRIIDGIGTTEMIHIFISAAGEAIRPGCTGVPVPGYQACVLDEAGAALPPGSTGRLAVKGPTGCRYLADERQRDYVVDGWNVTGDLYHLDEDGYFSFRARSDDMIISSGYNIAGPEVEAALLSHPAVAECAVVASPHPERGHIPKAFVALQPGHAGTQALARELQEHVKSTIAPYKYPRAIEFVEALPKTPTGKVQRYKLRVHEEQRAAAGTAAGAASGTTSGAEE